MTALRCTSTFYGLKFEFSSQREKFKEEGNLSLTSVQVSVGLFRLNLRILCLAIELNSMLVSPAPSENKWLVTKLEIVFFYLHVSLNSMLYSEYSTD